jgi:hypothetical protein
MTLGRTEEATMKMDSGKPLQRRYAQHDLHLFLLCFGWTATSASVAIFTEMFLFLPLTLSIVCLFSWVWFFLSCRPNLYLIWFWLSLWYLQTLLREALYTCIQHHRIMKWSTAKSTVNFDLSPINYIFHSSSIVPKQAQKPIRFCIINTRWPKEKGQKDTQLFRKHTQNTKDRVTQTPLKLRCSGRVSSSCSTSGTRRLNLVTNP